MDAFAEHRKSLRKRLPDGLIVVGSAPEQLRNGDVHQVFRQSSDFLYLTGAEEPGCTLLLDPKGRREILFVPRLTQEHAVWLGHIPDLAEARRRFGIQEVRYGDELHAEIMRRKKGHRRIYAGKEVLSRIRPAIGKMKADRAELADALSELRAVKDTGEIALMLFANKVTGEGHKAAMRAARPGMYEYEVQAELEKEFRRAGLPHLAYPSIVATGKNSAVLHYHHNNAQLKAGDLLLIDAAAENKGYAADVTRTFPVSGRFTSKQRDVYDIVLHTQEECINKCRPGITSLDLHIHSERLIAEGLRDLGLLKGSTDELVESSAVRVFYPHGLSHMLGLDVHDVIGGKKRRIPVRRNGKLRFHAKLEPGFVVTMEPGIYFIGALLNDPKIREKHKKRVVFQKAEKYLNFGGIRIEDDVLVRKSGPPRNLTNVPKEPKEIEKICREKPWH